MASELRIAERRVHLRVPLIARCWCESEDVTLYARLVNASEGGIFVRTCAPLRLGVPARVRFALEDGEIAGDAIVARICEPADERPTPGMGLRFTLLDDTSAERLRAFVEGQDAAA